MMQTVGSPWFYTIFHIDVDKYLKKCKTTPMLAISGEKDLQIDALVTLNSIHKYLKKEVCHEECLIIGTNHLLQPCTTGSPDEYPLVETTIAPEVLGYIVRWMDSVCSPM